MKEHIFKAGQYKLDPRSVDRISVYIEEFFKDAGAVRREVTRNRLAAECCLEIWSAELGKDNACILKTGVVSGRKFIMLEAPGPMSDPSLANTGLDENSPEMQMFIDNTGFMASIGYIPEYQYINGNNVLRIWAPAPDESKRKRGIRAGAFFLAGVLAILLKILFPPAGQLIYDYAVYPVYSVFMRMLSTVCGPLVLFSVITSICGMGDMASFGKTGSVVVGRFIKTGFLLSVLAGAFAMWFFPVVWYEGGTMGSGLKNLIQMIVETVPSDIVSPFAAGNVLQIVFIGVVIGFTVMFLSGSVMDLSDIISQMHHVVLQIMRFLGMLMPYFMEVAVLKLFMTSPFSRIAEILKPVLIIWSGFMIMIAAETVIVSLQTKTSAIKLLKAAFPASLIALSTSSSSAALDKMSESCIDRLGVDETVANFAIPLGQVIFKPAAAYAFFVCALFAAANAGITINPAFLLMDLVVSWVLGTSMAPVAGAMVSCLSILYLQLGIPQDLIALGISISLFLDNIGTMTIVQLLQEEVYASQKAIDRRYKK